ncbi:hypothetical protein bcCo53_001155 (plasmid) [Borrelia coriaceae]|uniref:Uncharacterized protein n=1 Tax=Borrelia coriaceae ATCC 43381 TaxID=1408429 RepID=W5SWR1_9SPIR|nr:hypothetical protein [Borrelia coriaceae]AHH11138.1 Hypothetical protein BCO_0024300 [Borrelia coriaceae ATCC 43381]UPA16987.1 hypothetical protein bcCo53_001155 [Borrelia coriaceae]
MHAISPVFNELSGVLVLFKRKLENQRVAFPSCELNMNLKGALSEIYYPSDLEKVYDALGYDVEIVRTLGQIFDKLDFSSLYDRDTRTVVNLLNSFIRIGHSIRILFDNVLNKTKLDMLKFRDAGDLKRITNYLVQFIDAVKDLISRIKNGMVLAASKTDAEGVIRALNGSILASHDVRLRSMLRNIHGLLLNMMELIELNMAII